MPKNFKLHIGKKNINIVPETKYLGITFDCHLRFETEIINKVKKTKYLIFVLSTLSTILPLNSLRTIMFGLYYSVATYGIIAWGSSNKTLLSLLTRVHDKIMKIVYKRNDKTDIPLDLENKYILEALIYHYSTLADNYKKSQSITRNKSIMLPKVFKEIGRRNHYYIATIHFNKLQTELKYTSNFKSKFSKYLKNL